MSNFFQIDEDNTLNSERFKDFLSEYAIEDYQQNHRDLIAKVCKQYGDAMAKADADNHKCSPIMTSTLNCMIFMFTHLCPENIQIKSDKCDNARKHIKEWINGTFVLND